MVRFGPSGNSESFYAEGYSASLDMPLWLNKRGLNAYEYSLTRGINIGDELAIKLGELFKQYDIEISVHAPYYINLANPDPEMIEKSFNYILGSLRVLKLMQGTRCVFHPGSCGKMPREEAFRLVKQNMVELVKRAKAAGYGDLYICPETMGKSMQIGTYQEIAELCKVDDMVIPTMDFGHINSLLQGAIKGKKDYQNIIYYLIQNIGLDKVRKMHVHFSKIEYGPKGELKHLTFDDTQYGPEFKGLAEVIKEYNMSPVVICESKGTQAEDAKIMQDLQKKVLSR